MLRLNFTEIELIDNKILSLWVDSSIKIECNVTNDLMLTFAQKMHNDGQRPARFDVFNQYIGH